MKFLSRCRQGTIEVLLELEFTVSAVMRKFTKCIEKCHYEDDAEKTTTERERERDSPKTGENSRDEV